MRLLQSTRWSRNAGTHSRPLSRQRPCGAARAPCARRRSTPNATAELAPHTSCRALYAPPLFILLHHLKFVSFSCLTFLCARHVQQSTKPKLLWVSTRHHMCALCRALRNPNFWVSARQRVGSASVYMLLASSMGLLPGRGCAPCGAAPSNGSLALSSACGFGSQTRVRATLSRCRVLGCYALRSPLGRQHFTSLC